MKPPKERKILNISLNKIRISSELKSVQNLFPVEQYDSDTLEKDILEDNYIRDPLKCYEEKGYYYILGGYNRYTIAQNNNFKTVPVEDYSWYPKEKRKELCVKDNASKRQLSFNSKKKIHAFWVEKYPNYARCDIEKRSGVQVGIILHSEVKKELREKNKIKKLEDSNNPSILYKRSSFSSAFEIAQKGKLTIQKNFYLVKDIKKAMYEINTLLTEKEFKDKDVVMNNLHFINEFLKERFKGFREEEDKTK